MGRAVSLTVALVVLAGCTYPGSLTTTTSVATGTTTMPAIAGTTVTTRVPSVSPPSDASPDDCDVALSAPEVLDADEQAVVVFYQCGPHSTFPVIDTRVARIALGELSPLEATLRALLSGPTPTERDAGFVSFFNDSTAAALNWVTVEGTQAFVDFNNLIFVNNASTSTGGMFFMAELRANVFQFDEIKSVTWSVNGNCQTFGDWLQVGECMTDTRDAWEQMLIAWGETES